MGSTDIILLPYLRFLEELKQTIKRQTPKGFVAK